MFFSFFSGLNTDLSSQRKNLKKIFPEGNIIFISIHIEKRSIKIKIIANFYLTKLFFYYHTPFILNLFNMNYYK